MAVTVLPYIPSYVTVHLGAADSSAQDVTLPFIDYIKNVAASEVYPTWDEDALRANILAQVSFAINRIYTEFYPSRGYPFNITATTAMDQKFVQGRNTFDKINRLVDELFDTYIRRKGVAEPLSAKFCNGTTTTCAGLSQWGSEGLAQEGMGFVDILYHYYGDDIELVSNAPVQTVHHSYPGEPLRSGDIGEEVVVLQVMLNRISQAYPAIHKVWPTDGVFGSITEEAVREFQSIFSLTTDGIVGKSTWYKMVYLYVGLLQLSELISEGQRYFGITFQYPDAIAEGDQGEKVFQLQYFLLVIAQFNMTIPFVEMDGVFADQTRRAVVAFQRKKHLPQTGVVGEVTWNSLVGEFGAIQREVLDNALLFPQVNLAENSAGQAQEPSRADYAQTTRLTQYPGYDLGLGSNDFEGSSQ